MLHLRLVRSSLFEISAFITSYCKIAFPHKTISDDENIIEKSTQKELIRVTRETSSVMKGAAAGIVAGGLTFMAVKSLSGSRRLRRKTAAKAVKAIGGFMDML